MSAWAGALPVDPRGDPMVEAGSAELRTRLRRAVLVVAGLNLSYFFVEVAVALSIGSVSLFADSVDFLEDTAINLLIFLALGWSLRSQSIAGKVMAGVILVPALAAAWEAFSKLGRSRPAEPYALILTAGGAALVNLACSLVLARFRHHDSSMARAAFLSARTTWWSTSRSSPWDS